MNRHVLFEFFWNFAQGSVAEWSKALVLGTSHFGGVGSNPTTIKLFTFRRNDQFTLNLESN